MRKKAIPFIVIFFVSFLLLASINCSKKDTPATAKSSESKLVSFDFKTSSNIGLAQDVSGVINESAKTVTITLPPFTAVSNLIAIFSTSPKSICKVGTVVQQSGTTANNFINPVSYTITAEDGSEQTYVVSVVVSNSNEAKLTSLILKKQFNPLLSQDYAGVIDEANKKVTFNLPPLTQVTNLIATFTSSVGSTVKIGTVSQQSNITANNFTTPANYVITAQDGTTSQTYVVTANVALSDQNYITSFSFSAGTNTGIAKDIVGLITKDDKEILLRNPYLSKTAFISNFAISPGATLKLNGVTQTSGVTSNNFSSELVYEVVAQNGASRTYKVKTTAHITNFDEFIKECPMDDPNINQILTDFQIRIDGNVVNTFPCTNSYYPMTEAQYNDQVKWLQTLRILFYLDYGQSNHLPWTNLRIYDWLKSKIGGIDIQTGLNGGYCCGSYNGKQFITVGGLKNNPFGNWAQIPDLYNAWSMTNFVLLLHETRHLDGFPHSSCCVAGANRCDSQYDINNLSPYGMHMWWFNSILNRTLDFGFDCLSTTFKNAVVDGTWIQMDNQKTNFCIQPAIPAKPAYWNDCKYK
jgi:hypothetical protein